MELIWYALINGSVEGPMDEMSLKSIAKNGHLQPTDSVCRGKKGPWVQAKQVPGLINSESDEDVAGNADEFQATEGASKPITKEPIGGLSGISLRLAVRVAIGCIIVGMLIDVLQFLGLVSRLGFFWLEDVGLSFIAEHLKFQAPSAGILFYLFVVHAKLPK